MKKAEEYIDTSNWNDKWFWKIEEEVIKAIKQAQIEAIEETVKLCAENAEADIVFLGDLAQEQLKSGEPFLSEEDYEVYVLKQSILNCAEILKKEIE